MYKPKSIQENEAHKILKNFDIQTDHLILARRPDLVQIKKKKKGEHLSSSRFYRSSRPLRENKRKCKDKQMIGPCQRTKKKTVNICVTVIPIVGGVLSLKDCKRNGTVETTGRIKTIQIIALLRSARILRKVLETWEDLLSLRFQGKPTS